jgi:predicted metalloenzyme YecM
MRQNRSNPCRYLKPVITFKQLNDIAMQCSDNKTARRMKKARENYFEILIDPETGD